MKWQEGWQEILVQEFPFSVRVKENLGYFGDDKMELVFKKGELLPFARLYYPKDDPTYEIEVLVVRPNSPQDGFRFDKRFVGELFGEGGYRVLSDPHADSFVFERLMRNGIATAITKLRRKHSKDRMELELGYEGTNLMEAGYVYAPYIPVFTTNKIVMP